MSPPGNLNTGSPDDHVANIAANTYVVVNISANPVHVNSTPDGNYDLVYYEAEDPSHPGNVAIDDVIVGISNDPSGNPYYEVFNWGNGTPDTNTNVDTSDPPPTPPEDDNELVPLSEMHQDPAAPGSPQTGILIDVDTAPSHPPEGDYNYVVIVSPPSSDPAQVDSVQVDDVPIPP